MEPKSCLNCYHCNIFTGYNSQYEKTEMTRCWNHPDVMDHARVVEKSKINGYSCCNYESPETARNRMLNEAEERLKAYKKEIRRIEQEYPQLVNKDLSMASAVYADKRAGNDDWGCYRDGFKAGAEWAFSQGETHVGRTTKNGLSGYTVIQHTVDTIGPDELVTIQIRKYDDK